MEDPSASADAVPNRVRASVRSFPVADRELLALAAAVSRYPSRREALALERFGLTPIALWEKVDELLDDAAADAAMPVEVRRLRRLREIRRRHRDDVQASSG